MNGRRGALTQSRRRALAGTFGAAALALFCGPAQAIILGGCTASAGNVAFGAYDPLAPVALSSTATITVTCTLVITASPISIALSQGLSNSYAIRTMMSGTDTLNYNLYQDAAHTIIWGDGTGGSTLDNDKVTPGKPSVSATVYGLLPASQDVAAGNYLDTITVTVNY
jgi:spore coat protein U-like protein